MAEEEKKENVESNAEVKEEEPTIDILSHSYVPKFEILPQEEVEKILKELKVDRLHLPKILMTDPVVKLLNAKVNDLLKITRKSYTAGTSIFYRVVVNV
ncbi:DNA-directed RNA polymerase subunit H [Candidatus Tiddalikarchaeum anstoanum]|nr:DNA-directed RNA polymerase subunit H [Candidatus Tiddalikarchaeum anstoanum]